MRLARLLVAVVLTGSDLAHLAIAASPSFTLAPGAPTLGIIGATPADILETSVPPGPGPLPPPVVAVPAAALGLGPGDVLSGLSFGLGLPDPPIGLWELFSVSPATVGAASSTPQANVTCEAAGLEAEADVFSHVLFNPPPNVQALDGDGVAGGSCTGAVAPGLGLVDPPAAGGDDLTGLEACPGSYVFSAGTLAHPVYFTLAPGSPTLVAVGATAGDVLVAVPPGFGLPSVALAATALGLVGGPPGCGPPTCDAVDALEVGTGLVTAYSLAPGSPSLALCGLSAAGWMSGPAAPCGSIFSESALAHGLLATDDLDALAVYVDSDHDFVADACDPCPTVPYSVADTDGDGVCDAVDNCPSAPNPNQEDADQDGLGAACDPCDFGTGTSDHDGDSALDECDPCPTLPGVLPTPLAEFVRVTVLEPGLPPAKLNIPRLAFTTGATFNPATTDDVRATAYSLGASAPFMALDLPAGVSAQGQWVQPNPARKRWRYRNLGGAAAPVKRARLAEQPAGSSRYRLTLTGRGDLPGYGPARFSLEVGTGGTGLCFGATFFCGGDLTGTRWACKFYP